MNEPLGRRFHIEPLASKHERGGFTCAVLALDRYFATQAGQDAQRGFATVFVAVQAGTDRICGYYTLSMAGVAVDLLPDALKRKMPRYPSVPAVRLGRLAVATDMKGQGLGKFLMVDAMTRAMTSEIAWAAFVVDAKDVAARTFYAQYGFLDLADDPMHLFLPRKTVAAAMTQNIMK